MGNGVLLRHRDLIYEGDKKNYGVIVTIVFCGPHVWSRKKMNVYLTTVPFFPYWKILTFANIFTDTSISEAVFPLSSKEYQKRRPKVPPHFFHYT